MYIFDCCNKVLQQFFCLKKIVLMTKVVVLTLVCMDVEVSGQHVHLCCRVRIIESLTCFCAPAIFNVGVGGI